MYKDSTSSTPNREMMTTGWGARSERQAKCPAADWHLTKDIKEVGYKVVTLLSSSNPEKRPTEVKSTLRGLKTSRFQHQWQRNCHRSHIWGSDAQVKTDARVLRTHRSLTYTIYHKQGNHPTCGWGKTNRGRGRNKLLLINHRAKRVQNMQFVQSHENLHIFTLQQGDTSVLAKSCFVKSMEPRFERAKYEDKEALGQQYYLVHLMVIHDPIFRLEIVLMSCFIFALGTWQW